MPLRSDDLIPVNAWDDVPAFASEVEEADYWGTHCLGEPLLETLGLVDDDSLPPPRVRL